VLALVDAFEQLGNPFMEDSGELLDMDQAIFIPPDVVDNVRKVKNIGLERYKAFVDKRIYSQEEAFTATIPPYQAEIVHVFALSTTPEIRGGYRQRPTSKAYPDFAGSALGSQHQRVCVLP